MPPAVSLPLLLYCWKIHKNMPCLFQLVSYLLQSHLSPPHSYTGSATSASLQYIAVHLDSWQTALVCVCASLSPSQLQKIAAALKELLKAFCQCAGGLKAREVPAALMEVLPDRIGLFPDTSSCLTSQPSHLDTRRSHLNTTKRWEEGAVCVWRDDRS